MYKTSETITGYIPIPPGTKTIPIVPNVSVANPVTGIRCEQEGRLKNTTYAIRKYKPHIANDKNINDQMRLILNNDMMPSTKPFNNLTTL